jgi:AAA+ superfamily predicted ATPase
MDIPIFKWSITTGLQRLDLDMEPQAHLKEPKQVLGHLVSSSFEAIYMLLDFHPFLQDPVVNRYLKEVALKIRERKSRLVLISHRMDIPEELGKLTALKRLSLPDSNSLKEIVKKEATAYARNNPGSKVTSDRKVLQQLINNLKGLTYHDARRLARAAIIDDGAITDSDLPEVMRTKYELLNRNNLLKFELETGNFSSVAGMDGLKKWLHHRERFFHDGAAIPGMDRPRGILLLGVQGCGKSLAAKAVAGAWKVPLLQMDFGKLYNKYIGESEKNIREALKTAEIMAPCILWIDELEKGISIDSNDDGTSQRILGTLLTWMAENKKPVFIVTTSNSIEQLPPELIRKGRLDEVFFVDLPTTGVRETIFRIHAKKRQLNMDLLDLDQLAQLTEGFSGSEIEQLIVSAVYSAYADDVEVDTQLLKNEIHNTRPLSVLMAEKIEGLRQWARGRTTPVS